MTARVDPDLYRSDSLGNALGSLAGPLAAGALQTPLALTPAGRLQVAWTPRRPAVLATLAASLDTPSVRIDVTVDPDGTPTALPAVVFESYSETGATLPIYLPLLAAGATTIPGFTLAVTVTVQPESGPPQVLAPEAVGAVVSFAIVEGNMGKLLFLLGQEKARIRREGRRLAAMKLLASARLDALDRIGADLGVARFQDDLVYDAASAEVKTVILTDASGNPTLEADADYARRLAIYRPFQLCSRANLLENLNGPGAATDPNAGLISGLGLTSRFTIQDENSPFAVAIRIVGIGSEAPRDNFLAYVRSDILTWLPNTAAANAVHAARYLPLAQQAQVAALRGRLQAGYTFPAGAAVGPVLADTLDRLSRVLVALGFAGKPAIVRAQDPTAGSRYELGLGVDVTALAPVDLDALAARVNDTTRAVTADAQAESLIAAARAVPPASSAAQPDGGWLLSTCGFQTIHRLDPTTLYLSHLPVLGLEVDGPVNVAMGAPATYDAHFYPADDPAMNAALFSGLAAAATAWNADGQAAWTPLTPAQQSAAWAQVAVQATNSPAMETFAAAGLPAVANPATAVASLASVPADMLATIKLPPALAAEILAGNPAAIPVLRMFATILGGQSIASALPLVTATHDVIVVVSVLGLPLVGVNLGQRRTSGFRWYAVPLGGQAAVKAMGSSTTLQPAAAGALALVCLGYVREPGLADPYEVIVDLPDGAALTLKEYEFLMNTLQALYPVGIQVNTWSIRQGHVDLLGSGTPVALTPAVFRTFRSFQRRRLRGIYQSGT